jgi:hypothetical protein
MATPANDAGFVFHGTVVEPGASTMPNQVAPSSKTAIVRIDDIVSAPPALAGYAGQNVTVLLQDREHVRAGERATFYTNASVFGESVAVQSLGHEDVGSLRASEPDLRPHAAAAETVVTGTVTSTHPASAPATATEPGSTTSKPISEHDPDWHDAVVTISNAGKGGQAQKQIVVRYPNSTDVRWYRVPKLRAGMTGSFILHPADSPEIADAATADMLRSAVSAAPQPPEFVLLHPEDFQPQAHVEP